MKNNPITMKQKKSNMHRIVWALAIFIWALIAAPCPGEQVFHPAPINPATEPWRWRSFSELKGLGLRCMVQATDGAMWFGIDGGARRYDGIRWEDHTPADGLYGAPVNALCAATDGSVYAGTAQGISRYQNGAWTRVFPKSGDLPWFVSSLTEAADGSLWAGTAWGALHLYKDRAWLFASADLQPVLAELATDLQISIVPAAAVPFRRWGACAGIQTAGPAELWEESAVCVVQHVVPNSPGARAGVQIGDRLIAINGQPGGTQKYLEGPPGTAMRLTLRRQNNPETLKIDTVCEQMTGTYGDFSVYSILETDDGALWFGLREGEVVRYRPDSAEETWRLYTKTEGFAAGRLPRFCQDEAGAIWVVSNDRNAGVNRFDGSTWSEERLSERGGVDINTAILKTTDGTLWVGGNWGVLHAFRKGTWTVYHAPDTPIPGTRMVEIMQAADGAVWFAGAGQEAARFDATQKQWRSFQNLHFQCDDADGALWFLSKDNRAVRIESAPASNTEEWAQTSFGVDDGLMEIPHMLLTDRHGAVWAAGRHKYRAATARFDGRQWQREMHPRLSYDIATAFSAADLWFGAKADCPPEWACLGGALSFNGKIWTHHTPPDAPQAPFAFGQTPDGIVWVGGDRLRRFDPAIAPGQVAWTSVTTPKELALPFIDHICVDRDGGLWIGTRAYGVFYFNGRTWRHDDIGRGLADDRIEGIAQTRDGSIWVTTPRGVSRFDGQSWMTHALPEDLAHQIVGPVRETQDGLLWLNLADYRTVCYRPDTVPPETDLSISLEHISWQGTAALSWHGVDPWNETPPKKLRYAYRLDNQAWSQYTANTHLVLSHLEVGQHRFEVRARGQNFNEDPTPARRRFEVDPPVWRQPWFIGLVIVLTGGIGIQTGRVLQKNRQLRKAHAELRAANVELEHRVATRTAELRRTNAQLETRQKQLEVLSRKLVEAQEDERRHIARELHDEIGSMLTGLKLSLELTARRADDDLGRDIEKAKTLVTDVMGVTRNLSHDLRPAMLDDMGLLSALLWYAGQYTNRTGIQVQFHHTGVEDRRFAPETETTVYRIVQEALTNIARHANVTTCTVRIWISKGMLYAQIEDLGKGLDRRAAQNASGGLAGMQERASLLGGRLRIASKPGAGAQITAELPVTAPPENEEKTP